MTITLTALHEQLLKDTCRMLQYDINALTPAQEVRLSRAAMLRLELDDCATKKLAGQPFDTVKYIAASEALERLIGSDPEQTNAGYDFTGAKAELTHFFNERAAAIEYRELKESARLLEVNAQLREQITQLQAQLTAQPQQPPPRPNNVVPIDGTARANANRPPEHYLREGQREPWRDYAERGSGVPGGVLGEPLPSWWGK